MSLRRVGIPPTASDVRTSGTPLLIAKDPSAPRPPAVKGGTPLALLRIEGGCGLQRQMAMPWLVGHNLPALTARQLLHRRSIVG